MAKINYWKLIISLVICQLAGIIGSLFTAPSISNWYSTLNKPPFNPPGWIFGPVWIILYLLMGISLYLVWNNRLGNKKSIFAIKLFILQLVLNALWSILFFGLHSPFLAVIEIVLLLITIIITTVYFYKISKTSAYLIIPYILWVSFATLLNFSIWILNK